MLFAFALFLLPENTFFERQMESYVMFAYIDLLKKSSLKINKVSTVNSLAFLVQVLVQMIMIVSVLIPGDVEDKIRIQ